MRKRFEAICGMFVVTFVMAAAEHSVKPPFPAGLHADCALGGNPDSFWVAVDRVSATRSRIVFTPRHGNQPGISFVVPGVLAGFQTLADDLLLTFENPGPTTRAYSKVGGKVAQIFECTSRFGAEAVPIRTVYGGALVCYQGGQMVGPLWVPTVAKIYLRGEQSFDLTAEVPYRRLFSALGEIHDREARKLAGSASVP